MSKTIKPFAKTDNNYTMVHNYLFDYIMPEVKPNAWKVLCLIVRKTRGWHKDSDELAFSQIRAGTGIASNTTVSLAIKELVDNGYIINLKGDQWEATTYALNENLAVTVSDDDEPPVTETVTDSITETVTGSVTETVDTKEKERKEKKVLNALADSLAEVCQIDIDTASQTMRKRLKTLVISLHHKGVTNADLTDFKKWWSAHDWRGKKGQHPTPTQVGDEWGAFEAYRANPQSNGSPPADNYRGSNPDHQYQHNMTPEQWQAYQKLKAVHFGGND